MKKLSPQSIAAINRLAAGLLTLSPVDRGPAHRLIFQESWRDFRAKHPELPAEEIFNATAKFMRAIDDRFAEMIAAGAGGDGGHA